MGDGSISIHRCRDGSEKFRARLSLGDGRRLQLGLHPTREAAETALQAARAEVHAGTVPTAGLTLATWGARTLDRRETSGIRGIDQERSRWHAHVEKHPIVQRPIANITRAEVVAWIASVTSKLASGARAFPRRRISRRTAQNALNLLRAIFEDATERAVISANPARDVRVPKKASSEDIAAHEPWTYLLPEEIERLRFAPSAAEDRRVVSFAIGTGLRQGEQWALRIADVHADADDPHVVVRYGRKGKATKSGRIRRVPLFGMALDAAREQIASKPKPNPHGLLWPALRGGYRPAGKPPRGWEEWLASTKLNDPTRRHDGQRVRWHDLRHTCASALVSGWWGRRWSREEIQELLGHSTVAMTERYAHLADSALATAARGTGSRSTPGADTGHRVATAAPDLSEVIAAKVAESLRSHLRDLNSRPTVYEGVANRNEIVQVDLLGGHRWPATASDAIEAISRGDGGLALPLLEQFATDVDRALVDARDGRWARAIDLLTALRRAELPVGAGDVKKTSTGR